MTTQPYPQYEKISLVNFLLLLSSDISVIILMVRRLSDINNICLINISSCSLLCGGDQGWARRSDGGSIVTLLVGRTICYLPAKTDNLIWPCLTSPYRRENPRWYFSTSQIHSLRDYILTNPLPKWQINVKTTSPPPKREICFVFAGGQIKMVLFFGVVR